MTDFASLGIKVDSRQVVTADRDLDKFSGAAKKAESSTKKFSAAAKLAGASIAGLSVSAALGKTFSLSDQFNNLNNQLRQLSSSEEELASTRGKLLSLAKETRSSLDASTNLYARLTRATDGMGISQKRIIALTGTINKSFAINGATVAESSNAIRQLAQGLAAGALRGDEFNSVSEQAPAIMDALAKSLNLTKGELRDFAATGGITSETLIKAIEGAAGSIDDRFSKTLRTFGQSMEIANNNMLTFAGKSETLLGATSLAGNAIVGLTSHFGELGLAVGAVSAVFAGRLAGSLADTRQKKIALVAANKIVLKSELELLRQGNLRAIQEQAAAKRSLTLAFGAKARAVATTNLTTANAALTASTNALSASTAGYTALTATAVTASGALSFAARGAAASMAFLGGPLGIGLIAVAGILAISTMDTLAERADKLRDGFDTLSFEASTEAIRVQQRLIDKLEKSTQSLGPRRGAQKRIAKFNKELDVAKKHLQEMKSSLSDRELEKNIELMTEGFKGYSKTTAAAAQNSGISVLNNMMSTGKIKAEDYITTMRAVNEAINASNSTPPTNLDYINKLLADGTIKAEDYVTTMQAVNAELNNAQPPKAFVNLATLVRDGKLSIQDYVSTIDRIGEAANDTEPAFKKMSAYSDQAARSMQGHFADFLFDPFDKGLKGLVKGFADAMKRMLAEKAAAKLFDFFGAQAGSGGIAGFIGSLLTFDGGGSTGSGPRTGGTDGKGGFPAILHPNETVIDHTRTNNMGSNVINININAPGADQGTMARLEEIVTSKLAPQIISAATNNTMAQLRRPRFA